MTINNDKTGRAFYLCGMMALCLLVADTGVSAADPNNAALLYYQALLMRPEPDDYRVIEDVLHDAEPSDRLREYLKIAMVRETIGLAEAGTRISDCDWGGRRSDGPGTNLNGLPMGELTRLMKLLSAHARLLAHDGDYRAALESCLAMRRLAAHLGDDSAMLYAMAYSAEIMALRCVQYTLWSMPPDADILTWLQDQLRTVQGILWKPADAIRREHNARVDNRLRRLSVYGGDWKTWFVEMSTDASTKERIRNHTEDELLAEAREFYMHTLESAIAVIESNIPVEDRHEALAALKREIDDQAARGEPVALLRNCWDGVQGWLQYVSAHALWYNSTLVAVEVYLIKARTGQLPATLPKDLPRAPYTGSEFEYAKTDDGFVLRYLKEDYTGRSMREIEFPVRDE